MATWILLRHGESVANAENWLAGHIDTPLTALGRAQAVAAGRTLAQWPLGQVLSSDLSRARDTALIALHTWSELRGQRPPALQQLVSLRERDCGTWAHRDRAELRAAGLMSCLTDYDSSPPGGESQARLARRVLPALLKQAAINAAAPSLIVAHGGVLRILLAAIDGTPRDKIGFFGVSNAEPIIRHVSTISLTRGARALGVALV